MHVKIHAAINRCGSLDTCDELLIVKESVEDGCFGILFCTRRRGCCFSVINIEIGGEKRSNFVLSTGFSSLVVYTLLRSTSLLSQSKKSILLPSGTSLPILSRLGFSTVSRYNAKRHSARERVNKGSERT